MIIVVNWYHRESQFLVTVVGFKEVVGRVKVVDLRVLLVVGSGLWELFEDVAVVISLLEISCIQTDLNKKQTQLKEDNG